MLASALVFGLAIGVGATVFGYSNTGPVDLSWSVFHLRGVPLWSVVLVPLGVVLIAGTLFHWFNSLHHFTEHMRHRRRVHELEVEVSSLRKHLDELLQMPGHAESGDAVAAPTGAEPLATAAEPLRTEAEPPRTEAEPAPEPARGDAAAAAPSSNPVASNGEDRTARRSRRRASLTTGSEPEPVAVATNGAAADDELDTAPDAPPTAGS